MMGERRPNFAIFVVWSAGYVSTESREYEGSISSCSFYVQLADYYSHDLSVSVEDFILLSLCLV